MCCYETQISHVIYLRAGDKPQNQDSCESEARSPTLTDLRVCGFCRNTQSTAWDFNLPSLLLEQQMNLWKYKQAWKVRTQKL